ncbi:flavodoxin [Uliginosibacterium sediminicola]|uniref:Flavodoxin n=1 Tax=Uliginosibacterium sediminicola TaxID=2024550 RepID=A0ABU9Z0V3_9RHOO
MSEKPFLKASALAARRQLLKTAAGGLVAGLATPILSATASAQTTGKTAGKILIAYYSRTGTTREMATQIQQKLGGDLFELRTAHTYPKEYRATTNQAKREQQERFRPQLTTEVQNMAGYDTVFIGYPNWWGTLPMAFFSFLERYDLAGKKIIPFSTHEGSHFGSSLSDIRTLCPKSTLLEGIALRGGGIDKLQSSAARAEVAAWLQKIGMVA